jgi:hypothetical protein
MNTYNEGDTGDLMESTVVHSMLARLFTGVIICPVVPTRPLLILYLVVGEAGYPTVASGERRFHGSGGVLGLSGRVQGVADLPAGRRDEVFGGDLREDERRATRIAPGAVRPAQR